MTRTLRYLVLLIAITLYAGACSRDVLRFFYKTNVIADDYRYGDLYRLSNLPQFKEPQTPCPTETVPITAQSRNTHLYLIGDSFTEPQRISEQDFGVEYYQYTHWEKESAVQLDTTKQNILLIETVERHFREHFSKPIRNIMVVKDTQSVAARAAQTSWLRQLSDQIKSLGIEERLETILFSHTPFLWLKERKASLTFSWFDRVNPKVGLSRDKQHVFAGLDTDTTTISSSFTPLSNRELNALVDSLNTVYERYRQLGFNEVYLSIIPNKASIIDPELGDYNYLIERVQQHPARKIPIIDIYSVYKSQKQPVYATGDSHWNCTGRALWLTRINAQILSSNTNRLAK